MNAFGVLAGLAVVGFLLTLVVGLATGRIPWRQQACCCPADPSQDGRMRTHDDAETRTTSPSA